jgi:hypothetical protein
MIYRACPEGETPSRREIIAHLYGKINFFAAHGPHQAPISKN